ncbi:Epimerase family protein SDR39U1 [Trinorchestia longiramus]|nr:Epimerase family protein SDR39U1 [Trinorchestia longiramus]
MTSQLGKVVVGGGSGFIGSALTRVLQKKGYEVVVVSRKPGAWRITWEEICSSGLPANCVAVVNVAGQNILDPMQRWTPGFKQNVWASRVETTKYLADAIRKADKKPKVFASMSGVGYYPTGSTTEFDESSQGGDFDYLSRLCEGWEAAAKLDLPEVRTVSIRTGVVLGRNGGMIQQLFMPFFLGLGGPVGSGEQPMPWIHLDDIVGLFDHAVHCEQVSGVLNGVAPQIITNAEFSKAFAAALRRPAVIPLPTPLVNLMFGEERAKIMTEGQKVKPTLALKTGYKFKFPDIKSACEQVAHFFPMQ